MNPPEFLTTLDVALKAQASSESVRVWHRRGLLKATRTASGQRLFKRDDVEEFLKNRVGRRRGESR